MVQINMGVNIANVPLLEKHGVVFPYAVLMNKLYIDMMKDVRDWCMDSCSGRYLNKRYGNKWASYDFVWFFTEKDDAALFKLTWG